MKLKSLNLLSIFAPTLFISVLSVRGTNSLSLNEHHNPISLAQTESSEVKWPASIKNKPVLKTFRFRPTQTDWYDMLRRRLDYSIVFKIEDRSVPADYFVVSTVWDTEVACYERAIASDGGYITVVASAVKPYIRQSHYHHKLYKMLNEGDRILEGTLKMKGLEDPQCHGG
jgi:hypothetical protein